MMNSRKNQLLKLLEQDPDDCFLLFALAKEHEYEESWLLAKEAYQILNQKDASYLAFYYHFGKLCEQLGDKINAANIYKEGINKCLEFNDLHSKSELQSALMNLEIE